MSFSQLGLSSKVLSAVQAAGFESPTPIQAQAVPHAVAGRDVLGIAQTGTGKTASFVLPMLTRLERGRARARMPRSLILAPTRELAAQVAEHFEILGKNHNLTVALLIGGVSYEDQDRKLDRGAGDSGLAGDLRRDQREAISDDARLDVGGKQDLVKRGGHEHALS